MGEGEAMTDFFAFIKDFCLIAVAGGLVMLMSPNGNLSKHVKFLISLCMVCALLSAVISVSGKADEFIQSLDSAIKEDAYQNEYDSRIAVAKQAKSNMEDEVERLLTSKFGIDQSDVRAVITLDTKDLSAVEITGITLFLGNMDINERACGYIAELFGEEVTVIALQKGG